MNSRLACPVCQVTERFRFVERCGDYVLHHCRSCDVVFSHPMKGGDHDWYDKTYVIRHLAIDDRIMWYFSWAVDNLPKNGKLLDVGCGAGTFVSYALKREFDAYGIDFSLDAIEVGKRRFGLDTVFATTLSEFRRGHPHEIFDAITMFEVLEHLETPGLFLEEIKALLRPGGQIALSVPNRDRWPIRDFADYPPNHLTRWSDKALRRLLETSGFDILKIEHTPILLSINFFFGYLLRVLIYKMLNFYGKGLARAKGSNSPSRWPSLEKVGSLGSKVRRWRDASMWIPTIVALPVCYPVFEGYNIVALARKSP